MLAEVFDVGLKDRSGGLGNHYFPQDFNSSFCHVCNH